LLLHIFSCIKIQHILYLFNIVDDLNKHRNNKHEK
jgi:hypothetical protein